MEKAETIQELTGQKIKNLISAISAAPKMCALRYT